MYKLGFICMITILQFTQVHAHSGGTNSQGCHNNTKTGDYHCHR